MRGRGGRKGEKVEQIALRVVPQSWKRKVLLGLRTIEFRKNFQENRFVSVLMYPLSRLLKFVSVRSIPVQGENNYIQIKLRVIFEPSEIEMSN